MLNSSRNVASERLIDKKIQAKLISEDGYQMAVTRYFDGQEVEMWLKRKEDPVSYMLNFM